MPSFLVTERMSPELRARVLQSLKSDARARVGGENKPRTTRLFRLALVSAVAVSFVFLFLTFRKSKAEIQQKKAQLSQEFRVQTAPLNSEFQTRLRLIDDKLRRSGAPYPGDTPKKDLPAARERLFLALKEPMVYARGPTRGFERESERRNTWGRGGPDALLRCLISPPGSIKESALLRHLGELYEPRAFRSQFINLDSAFEGLAFIESPFSSHLRDATHMRELRSLEQTLKEAKLKEAADFSRAKTAFFVFDEPKAPGTATDFDGEAVHHVRFFAVDLDSGEAFLRLRREVSPEWISEKSRLSYSRELDSCRLAFEVRAQLDAE